MAPERLFTDKFLYTIKSKKISLIAVDEAHCVSQWGFDFRPSYLKIADFVRELRDRPVLAAFTATATKEVQKDIVRLLEMNNPMRLVTGFDRPNLRFEVINSKDKISDLQNILARHPDESGIVYCSTRKDVERVFFALNDMGYQVSCYHAGLEEEEKYKNQKDFICNQKRIMVATNAFGMGIDKPDIRYVVHTPKYRILLPRIRQGRQRWKGGRVCFAIFVYRYTNDSISNL